MGHRDYVLITDQNNFTNAGLREPRFHTYHQTVLAVLCQEGETQPPILTRAHKVPYTEEGDQTTYGAGGSITHTQGGGGKDATSNRGSGVLDFGGVVVDFR